MTRWCTLAVLVLLGISAHAQLALAQPAQVTVTDHLSTGQLEETMAVYIAGHLVGTLHVDATHPDDSFTTGISGAGRVTYALCGLLRRQTADGTVTDHRIDNAGMLLTNPGGHYAALTLNDVVFALVDEASDSAERQVSPGPACAAAVS